MSSARGEASGQAWPRHCTIVLLLFAAVFISYIDRTNISVAAIAMKDDLGWTETQKGVVLSAFFVGYLLLMAVTGAGDLHALWAHRCSGGRHGRRSPRLPR